MITYKYAKDSANQRVDIGDINNLNKSERYTCIGCEKEMIPCLGKVKKHYFRHKTIGECSGETYLHLLGKMTFKEVYESCLNSDQPFIFQFDTEKLCSRPEDDIGVTCSLGEVGARLDLTRRFTELKVEKKDGEFIPDVQLISKNNEIIYIEIVVTHKSEKNKQKSGKKIIEFLIESEKDIKHIESKLIYWGADWIKTYGINPKPIKGVFCDTCKEKGEVFVVGNSGKSILTQVNYFELKSTLKKLSAMPFVNYSSVTVCKYNKTKTESSSRYRRAVVKAYRQGAKIKNCYLCRYHSLREIGENEDGSEPVFCRLFSRRVRGKTYLKKISGPNYASDCTGFWADEEVFKKYEQDI